MKGARALTKAEVRRVWRELEDRRARALFAVMLYTGARISEALALDVDDVRRPGDELEIRRQILFPKRKTKGKRESRAVDVHPELRGALLALLSVPGGLALTRGPGPLFLSRGSRRLSRFQAWRTLDAAFTAAGLEDRRVTPHSLRRTFARRLLETGTEIPVIQELLGHADVRDTIEYLRDETQHAGAVGRLPAPDDDDDDD